MRERIYLDIPSYLSSSPWRSRIERVPSSVFVASRTTSSFLSVAEKALEKALFAKLTRFLLLLQLFSRDSFEDPTEEETLLTTL